MPGAGTVPTVAAMLHNDAPFLAFISVFGFDFAQRCHGRCGDALCGDHARLGTTGLASLVQRRRSWPDCRLCPFIFVSVDPQHIVNGQRKPCKEIPIEEEISAPRCLRCMSPDEQHFTRPPLEDISWRMQVLSTRLSQVKHGGGALGAVKLSAGLPLKREFGA
jgi:hypothetical protein